jgi:hypothetical protein
MTRHAFFVLVMFALTAIAGAQQFAAPSASPVLAVLSAHESEAPTATQWRGQPEAEAVRTAPSTASPVILRVLDGYPVLSGQESFLRDHAGSAHTGTLQMFSGARLRDVVQLKWVTTRNNTSVGFEIERRTQSHPEWKTVKYFRSKYADGKPQDYTFMDYLKNDGVVYYRLRQIGAHGGDIASPIISVTPDNVPHSFGIWQRSTTPFQSYGTVSFGLDAPTSVTLSLIDRFGKVQRLLIDNTVMEEGHHIIPFGTEGLLPGLYFLRITSVHGSENIFLLHS